MNFFKKFNKLDFGDKAKKKKIISLAVTIVGILLIVTGTSAAYLMSQKEGTKNTITAGTLVLSLPTESEGITLNGALPISDEAGVSGSNSYTFTLKNSGTLKMNYAIYLKNKCSTTSSITINSETITPDICIPNEYVKVGLKKGTEDYQIITLNNDELLIKGTMNSNETIDFSLKIWLDENTPNEYNAILDGVERNIIYYGKLELTGEQTASLDTSGANKPVLATGMIPVYYDESAEAWKKADEVNKEEENKWYDYNSKMWANAVTVTETNRDTYMKASAGTAISMNDINTMWVWIPRFSATGDTANYNGGTQSAPGAFNITFVDNKTSAHDAFTFGTQELNGFWVGKFETSHNTLSSSTTKNNLGCTGDTCGNANGIIIKPNVQSLRYNNVSNFFYASLSMKQSGNSFGFDKAKDTTLDTHMMKNNEWGAVAYLTQSIYGRCTSSTSCEEVSINNSSNYYTGRSGGAPGSSSIASTTEGTYKYNENKIEISVVEGTVTNVSTTVTNDSTYPWANTNGVYSSSNNGQNSTTATLTYSFTLSSKGVVSFDYSVSSESGYDKMSYVINNGTTDVITGDVISGTSRGTAESNLSYDNKTHILDAGTYTLTFTYSKDSSSASGLDKGYVKNVKVLAGVETIAKLGPGGQLASTTGNIYGVYDMSGGAHEYVMGVYTDGTQNWSGESSTSNSGFSGCLERDCSSTYDGVAYPESKYYNSYTNTGKNSSPITNYTSSMQHALTETKNWYGDHAAFVDGNNPWFSRGGYYAYNSIAGVFYYNYGAGSSPNYESSRSSLIIN